MNRQQLEQSLKHFESVGKTADDLNTLRTAIFDSFDNGDIQERTKTRLLKELYLAANLKGIFFLRVMNRVPGLPKNEEEEEERRREEEELDESYEESYEESYSYDEDEEDEDEDEEEDDETK